ncbi:DUF3558 domain-containing protein [Nocardia lijiangensis]|uniref:DUF3558 domain-containing protein n=1 Tax=Nocardia lijiangensis TaxID=299618 RepID=UPI0035A25D52
MTRLHLVVLAAISTIALAGCSTNDEMQPQAAESPTASVPPSMQVSVPPAPSQINNGRQPVNYDPCAELGDSTASRAGFDPATRKRSDFIFEGYSFIGCDFDRRGDVRGQSLVVGSMAVWSSNITLGEFRRREQARAQDTQVGGREAIVYADPQTDRCTMVMVFHEGTISVRVSANSGAFTPDRGCDRIREVSEVVESALPE